MGDSRPIMILVTAGNCGNCQKFKPVWPKIRNNIEKLGVVRVHEAEVPVMFTSLPPQFPKDLNRFIGFYPTFLLVEGNTWNASLNSKDIKIDARVYNGEFSGGRMMIKDARLGYTEDNLISWINSEVKKHVVTKQNQGVDSLEGNYVHNGICNVSFGSRKWKR